MTTIIVYGSIFDSLREFINKVNPSFFGKLITCVLCTSTWVGFFQSMVLGGFVNQFVDLPIWGTLFFDGMLTAGTVWTINSVVEFFEESRIR